MARLVVALCLLVTAVAGGGAAGAEPDCNGNGVPDRRDIAAGTSVDFNGNGVPDECDPDCNRNGLPDFIEILFDFAPDCNGNGIPDECDLDAGASDDCTGNGAPDECDIAEGLEDDCDRNGVPDACDIAGGAPDFNGNGILDFCERDCNGNGFPDFLDILVGRSIDCDGSGVPDECENDCNGNGIEDACDIVAGTSVDCDDSGVPDDCEIADRSSPDCNGNEVPDPCDLEASFTASSPVLSPIGFGSPQDHLVLQPPVALSEVAFSLTAYADVSASNEVIDVYLNGTYVGRAFQATGIVDCSQTSMSSVYMHHSTFNDLVAGGDALIEMFASQEVAIVACSDASTITVTLTYGIESFSSDDDGDGVPDECRCPADVVAPTGVVDVQDLVAVILAWGPCAPPCPADADGSGTVDVVDLVAVVIAWGTCP